MYKPKRTLLDEIRYYSFYYWYNWLSLRPLKIKSFFQRGWKGWADEDIWNFDCYLAKIISEGIMHIRENDEGIPCDLANKYNDKKALIERNKRLNKMIRAFKLHLIWVDGKILTKKQKKEYQEGLELFIKYMGDLWD